MDGETCGVFLVRRRKGDGEGGAGLRECRG